jgi:hypothetical protein
MRRKSAIAITAAALLAAGATASAEASDKAPGARAAATDFIQLPTQGRLNARHHFRVSVGCTVDCSVVARTKIFLPGKDLQFRPLSGQIQGGFVRPILYTLSGSFLRRLRANVGRARLRITVTGSDLATAEQDSAVRFYRFKR